MCPLCSTRVVESRGLDGCLILDDLCERGACTLWYSSTRYLKVERPRAQRAERPCTAVGVAGVRLLCVLAGFPLGCAVLELAFRPRARLSLAWLGMPPKGVSGCDTTEVEANASREFTEGCTQAGCKVGPHRSSGHDLVVCGPARAVTLKEAARALATGQGVPVGVDFVEMKCARAAGLESRVKRAGTLQFKAHRAPSLYAESCTAYVFTAELRPRDVQEGMWERELKEKRTQGRKPGTSAGRGVRCTACSVSPGVKVGSLRGSRARNAG